MQFPFRGTGQLRLASKPSGFSVADAEGLELENCWTQLEIRPSHGTIQYIRNLHQTIEYIQFRSFSLHCQIINLFDVGEPTCLISYEIKIMQFAFFFLFQSKYRLLK